MSPPFAEYLNAGLCPIPIRGDGSKAPALSTWLEFQTRRPTLEEAQEWERRFEGIGIVCGEISDNLEVIDIDEPTLVRPYLEAVRAADVTLYDRLCLIRTPRRNVSGQSGCHVVYRVESRVSGNAKLAMSEPEPAIDASGKPIIDPNTGVQKAVPRTLIETRGQGGYVVAPGSSARCHPSGNLYEHVGGPRLTELEVLTETERATLHTVARTFDRSIAETHVEPPVRGYEQASRGTSPGDEYNQQATWPEILQPHGWLLVGEFGGIKRWRRPGKATGISATTGVLSKTGNELLVVFSTSAFPFEGVNANGRPGVCYSKFAAYTLLNHGGVYESAAKALVQLGYGKPACKTENKARVLRQTAEDCERRYLSALKAGELELVSLGISTLDKAIGGGVEAGEMIVVGGLPSHGKSVFALQAARAVVERGRHAVLVSHEMGGFAVAKRLLQSRTQWETRDWAEHADQLADDSAIYWRAAGKLFLLEQCRSIDRIETEVDAIAAEFDLGLVVIDHAQLTEAKGRSRYEMLTEASGRFKQIAVKHNCPVLIPSQLNREAAKGEEAGAHNLKETGALEQDADVVILVRWPWKADPDNERDPGRYVFKICKNRNRPIVAWQVDARFNPARQAIDALKKPEGYHNEFDSYSGSQSEE